MSTFNPARFKKRTEYTGFDYRTAKPFKMRGADLLAFLEGMRLTLLTEPGTPMRDVVGHVHYVDAQGLPKTRWLWRYTLTKPIDIGLTFSDARDALIVASGLRAAAAHAQRPYSASLCFDTAKTIEASVRAQCVEPPL